MITGDEKLSQSAKKFYTLLKDSAHDLLGFMSIASPTDEFPYIEPGSIVLQIPSREGFPFDKLYVETRKDDILIVMGDVLNHHISWGSEDSVEKQMKSAIQLIDDVLNEQVVFVKKKVPFGKKESYEHIRVEELEKATRVIAVYSWKGTYDRVGK
jgi:hypothetical protein